MLCLFSLVLLLLQINNGLKINKIEASARVPVCVSGFFFAGGGGLHLFIKKII